MHRPERERVRTHGRATTGGRRGRARGVAPARDHRRGRDRVPLAADDGVDRAAARRDAEQAGRSRRRSTTACTRRCRRSYRAAAAARAARWTCARTTRSSPDPRLLVEPRRPRGRRGSSRHHATVSASVRSSGISGSQPVAACSRSGVPRTSMTSCARTSAGSIRWSTPAPGHAAELRDQLAGRAERPEQTLTTPGSPAVGEQPVGAHDVAHVGVVAARVRVAGDDADRVVARLEPGRDLAGEGGDRVDRRLARPGVVERARADHPQAVRVGVEAGQQVGRRLRDRVRVLRAQRRVLVTGSAAGGP